MTIHMIILYFCVCVLFMDARYQRKRADHLNQAIDHIIEANNMLPPILQQLDSKIDQVRDANRPLN